MPYRTELKRPDLKGTFPCSVCGKIFCHSSSLSRHRMQAHFKSYQCKLCNQEISSNETLRSHMFRNHSISRMFMCRCCNWAFPDKTSLHIHMQSMVRNGTPGDVQILAKSNAEAGGVMDPALFAKDGSGGMTMDESPSPVDEMDDQAPDSPANGNMSGLTTAQLSAQLAASMPPNSIFPSYPSRQQLLDQIKNGITSQSPSSMVPPRTPPTVTSTSTPPPPSSSHDSLMQAATAALTSSSLADLAQTAPHPLLANWLANNFANPWQSLNLRGGQVNGLSSPTPSPSTNNNNNVVEQRETSVNAQQSKCPLEDDDAMLMNETLEINVKADPTNASYMTECSETNTQQMKSSPKPPPMSGKEAIDAALRLQHKSPTGVGGDTNQQIVSNPYTSLMYRKKVSNVLRNKQQQPPPVGATTTTTGDPPQSPDNESDCHTSSSGAPVSSASDSSSPQKTFDKCYECQVTKGRLALAENRNRFLESKTGSLSNKIKRLESQVASLESSSHRYETEHKVLRQQCELLERQLLMCQEKALLYMQSCASAAGGNTKVPATGAADVKLLLEDLLKTTSLLKGTSE